MRRHRQRRRVELFAIICMQQTAAKRSSVGATRFQFIWTLSKRSSSDKFRRVICSTEAWPLSCKALGRNITYAKDWIYRSARFDCGERPTLPAGGVYFSARRARFYDQTTEEAQRCGDSACRRAGTTRRCPPVRAQGIWPDGIECSFSLGRRLLRGYWAHGL